MKTTYQIIDRLTGEVIIETQNRVLYDMIKSSLLHPNNFYFDKK